LRRYFIYSSSPGSTKVLQENENLRRIEEDPESNLQEVHIMKNALYLPPKKERRFLFSLNTHNDNCGITHIAG
jgi:hypothetical protein